MKIPDYNKKIKHPTYLEMQQEIERLKEEYMILQNASDEVEEEKDKEIERLNNIINELEKELDKGFEVYICNGRKAGKSIELGYKICQKKLLNKLKELKGSDKE